jgi:peptidoglycan/xylan/chitin deacetylase (PgdA/CDA1 family)
MVEQQRAGRKAGHQRCAPLIAAAVLVATTTALVQPSSAASSTLGVPQPACTPGALIRSVATSEPEVALTFDDGPWPETTRGIMDALRARGLEGVATFYMVGMHLQNNPAIAREVAARGYDIGNHSISHRYVPSIIASEIEPMQRLIADTTGITPDTFRSPGLTEGSAIQAELRRLGLCNVFTRFSAGDALSPRISASQICANIRNNVRAGDIVLLHDGGGNHGPTLQAMRTCVVETIRAKGLRIVREDELLSGVPPVPAGGVVEVATGTAPGQTVVGQVTIDQARGPGFLTVYPCADGRPVASDLNYTPGQPTTNAVVTRADAAGKICIYTHATTHLIYDQTAEVDATALPVGNAVRLLDTREGEGKVPAGTVRQLRVAGPDQVVVGQLTNDRAESTGFLTAYPCLAGRPLASDLNMVPGSPTSNRLVAKTDANGDLCIYTSATTDLIYDQSGAFDAALLPLGVARRILDTRSGDPVAAGGVVRIPTGAPNQTAVGQITADRSTGPGFVTLYPCAEGRPLASHLNLDPARPRSSRVFVKADAAGDVCAFTSTRTDLVFDLSGAAPWASHAAVRLLDTRDR